ncbi:Membrane protein involved in the export of O-antigen and teichoic acid [Jatrophihabitans endophyticus]|uniref:Membrane protein involved in the export of O-antigen and teichoic acid n=1 Tax=Jatrophihabitans endophyticus TaxID=1206085 RepID=A0A1M5IJR5_9ACTN|nr:Membrane protein involved in the export of O-antigen and teichoic acid [Jatrophihabitans endophyticus]
MRGTAIRSALWVALGKWGNQLATLVVFTLLGRLLAPSELGLAALATVFVTLFQVLSDQGFSTALIQKKHVDDADRNTAFWISVGSALVLMALVAALAPLASSAFDQPQLGAVLVGMSPMVLFTALAGTPQALLERDFQFRSLTMRTLYGSVIGGVAGVVVAFLGGGVWSIVVQSVVTSFVAVVFLWTVTKWRPGLRVSRRSARELRDTGVSVLGIQLIGLANAQGDKLIVGAALGPVPLGYYFVGTRIVTMLTDVQTSVIDAVSLTTLSKLQSTRERLRDAFYGLTSMGAATAIATFAIIAATADVSLPFVFGPQWEPAAPVMQILCLMGCLNAVIVFDRNALIAVGAARAALVITIVQCVIGLGAVAAAVPFGVIVVSFAVVLRQYAAWPLRLRTLRRHVGISIRTYLGHWSGPMLAGVVTFGVCWGVGRSWDPGRSVAAVVLFLAVEAVLGLGVYVASLRVTGPPAYRELRGLYRALRSRVAPRRHTYNAYVSRHAHSGADQPPAAAPMVEPDGVTPIR